MKKVELYYDGECPFCKEYSKFIELRKKCDITILDARENIEKIRYFKKQGYDINDGMIVFVDDKEIYSGADAAKVLDNLIENKSFIDKFISIVVKLPGFKSILYPIVKTIRIVILRLFGKNPNIKY